MKLSDSETGCCKDFDPKPWDGKVKVMKDKLFVKDHVRCFLRIPLNFGGVMKRSMEDIYKAGALAQEPLMLYECKGLFGADVFIHVAKDVPGEEMVRMSGTFLTKVFEGPYKDTSKWVREMKDYVKAQGKEMKDLYFFYTMCPKCAKHYGHNYTVLLARM